MYIYIYVYTLHYIILYYYIFSQSESDSGSLNQMYFYVYPGGVGQVMSKFVILEHWECGPQEYPKTIMTCTPFPAGNVCTSC